MYRQFLSSERGKNVNQPGSSAIRLDFSHCYKHAFFARPGLIVLSPGVGQTPISKPLHHSTNGPRIAALLPMGI